MLHISLLGHLRGSDEPADHASRFRSKLIAESLQDAAVYALVPHCLSVELDETRLRNFQTENFVVSVMTLSPNTCSDGRS